MSHVPLPDDALTPDGKSALRDLELATDSAGLDEAFAVAKREADRLAPSVWIEVAVDIVLSVSGFGLPVLMFSNGIVGEDITIVALAIIGAGMLRWATREHSSRARAYARVWNALRPWRRTFRATPRSSS